LFILAHYLDNVLPRVLRSLCLSILLHTLNAEKQEVGVSKHPLYFLGPLPQWLRNRFCPLPTDEVRSRPRFFFFFFSQRVILIVSGE
jgi:hypothetical protein